VKSRVIRGWRPRRGLITLAAHSPLVGS